MLELVALDQLETDDHSPQDVGALHSPVAYG